MIHANQGIQKAALLLTSLDTATARELLKGQLRKLSIKSRWNCPN